MKVSDVRGLLDLAPRERAALMLTLGADLQKSRGKAPRKGTLPKPLKQKSLQSCAAMDVLHRLHGIPGAEPHAIKGLRETGRRLVTEAGDIADLVMTPHALKQSVRAAMRKAKGESVRDLAIRQLALNMSDSAPVTRCCAAFAYWQATGAEAAMPILTNAVESEDEEEWTVAAHCLMHVNERLVRSLQGTAKDDEPHSPIQRVKKSMTVLVHGTFSMNSQWYQPGGDFHTYLKRRVYPDVYSKGDYFYWSGRYSLNDTTLKNIWAKAAKKLVAWCKSHPAKTLRLIGHSHGNNVINIATQLGLFSCTLIQLSPPVRTWNLPKMCEVSSGRLSNIHSRVDLVVKIDGGAQNYKGTVVRPNEGIKIIALFGHSDSHDPKKWARKNVPNFVRRVCP